MSAIIIPFPNSRAVTEQAELERLLELHTTNPNTRFFYHEDCACNCAADAKRYQEILDQFGKMRGLGTEHDRKRLELLRELRALPSPFNDFYGEIHA